MRNARELRYLMRGAASGRSR